MIRIAGHKNCDWQIRPFGEVGKEKTKTSEKENHLLRLYLPQWREEGRKDIQRKKRWKAVEKGSQTVTVGFCHPWLGECSMTPVRTALP